MIIFLILYALSVVLCGLAMFHKRARFLSNLGQVVGWSLGIFIPVINILLVMIAYEGEIDSFFSKPIKWD